LGERVKDFAKKDPRVQFLGFLSPEGIGELYESADVLVSPKRVSSAVAELSFPSKIVEYLSTGKPVISTDLPVFDGNFRQHLIIARSDTAEELIRCFKEVSAWNQNQCESWRAGTIRFVEEELSAAVQGARIRGFVDSLKYMKLLR
jgi:glycosyltransferase involved in cell wall biosynthesis